jgi:hypothetical protein
MTGASDLRGAIIGLLGFAAAEEQILLATAPAGQDGSPQCWAARPLVAHNTEFKHQQVQRLQAIQAGRTPPDFPDVDHSSADLYQRSVTPTERGTAADSGRVAAELIGGLSSVSDDDLCDPSRNPWLRGRQLWLQIIVRGFWHPAGHLGGYYLAHAQPDRAVALAEHGVTTARYLSAPGPARGMASYNLACAQARADRPGEAAAALHEAIALNPDVRANAARDPDLAVLREDGRLESLLGR